VLDLEEAYLDKYCSNTWKLRTLHALKKCRTGVLGGHIDKCNCCNKLHISYNSCRNRHCPTCQGHKVQEWIQSRTKELLNVPYFHVVFTLPHELNGLCLAKPNEMYAILFKTAWATLSQFGDNPEHTVAKKDKTLGVKMGTIGVLHTWGQNLSLHPHLHCIVPGGGITKNGIWKNTRSKGKYLFNVTAMSQVYRAKFVSELRKTIPGLAQSFYESLFKNEWVVYCKRTFVKPEFVIEYLGRYTHKIAISNYRIRNINKEKRTVTFSLKDYRNKGKKTTMTLSTKEFIRRFSLHILPKGFTRIRHYGILSSSWKKEKLPRLQELLNENKTVTKDIGTKQEKDLFVTDLKRCPMCKRGKLEPVLSFGKRGPPRKYKLLFAKQACTEYNRSIQNMKTR